MAGFKRQFDTEQIDSYGTDATVWTDLRFPASAVELDDIDPPSETLYKSSQVLAFANNNDNKIYFVAQLPHGYKTGTDLGFHIHIVLPTAGSGAGAENIKFDMTYSWAEIGADFPAETTITATRDVQNDTADNHIYFDIGSVLNSNMAENGGVGVSGMLLCSLGRDTAVADNYADVVYLLEADFHYEIDTLGSDLETQKRI